jgi:predicted transcriptional regulator
MPSYLTDITLISIGVATVAIIISVVTEFELRKRRAPVISDQVLDASALVQEFKGRYRALEEKLVDLRVRVEILDLRVVRMGGKEIPRSGGRDISRAEVVPNNAESIILSPGLPITDPNKGGEIDSIHREILKAVKNANGRATSRDIQVRIGRSREHVARTMNILRKQGLLYRSQETRPFTYSVTPEGERELQRVV